MPALTRKRVNRKPECWHVHYAGVRVGVLAERVGIPGASDRWEWSCGFYPGSHPRTHHHGTAGSFEAARAAFEAAWRDYLPKHTESDFQECRDHLAWTAAEKDRP